MKAEKRIYEKALLVELIKDKHSCLILKSCTRRIELQPKYLKEVKVGIKEALDQCLNRYDYSLNGILLDYQNLSVMVDNDSGKIVGKCGEFVVSIKGEFFVFQPEIGNLLKGVVNVKSDSHVGCLVHKRFNAMILKPENVEVENWNCRNIQIGDEIVFEIADHVLSGHVPFIEGKISGEYLEKKLRKKLKKSKRTTSSVEHSQHNGHYSVEDEILKDDEKTVSKIDEKDFLNCILEGKSIEEREGSPNISPTKKKSGLKTEKEIDPAPNDHGAKKKKRKKEKDKDRHKHKDKNEEKHKRKDVEDKHKCEDEDKDKLKEEEKQNTKRKSEKRKLFSTKEDELEQYNTDTSPTKSKRSKLGPESLITPDKCLKSESYSSIMEMDFDGKRNVKDVESESIAKGSVVRAPNTSTRKRVGEEPEVCTPDTSMRKRTGEKPKKTPAKKSRFETDDGLKQRLIDDMLQSKRVLAEEKFEKPVTTSTPILLDNSSKNMDKKDSCMISTPKSVVNSAIIKEKKKKSSKTKSQLNSHKSENEEERKSIINALLDSVKLTLGINDITVKKSSKSETKKEVEDPIFQWLRKSVDKSTQQVQKSSKGDTSRLSSADSGFNSVADRFKI